MVLLQMLPPAKLAPRHLHACTCSVPWANTQMREIAHTTPHSYCCFCIKYLICPHPHLFVSQHSSANIASLCSAESLGACQLVRMWEQKVRVARSGWEVHKLSEKALSCPNGASSQNQISCFLFCVSMQLLCSAATLATAQEVM